MSKWFLFGMWCVVAATQAVLSISFESLFAFLISLPVVYLVIKYLINKERVASNPISTLITLGCAFYYFILPPIATSFEFKPLINNLKEPIADYLFMTLFFGSTFTAYIIYIKSSSLRKVRFIFSENLYRRLGLFSNNKDSVVWIMGLSALFIAAIVTIFPDENSELTKILKATQFISALPLFLIVKKIFGFNDDKPMGMSSKVFILIYLLIIFILSIAQNSRGIFLTTCFSLLLAYIIGICCGWYNFDKKSRRRYLILLATGVLIYPIYSRISDSMLVARDIRSDSNVVELASYTLDAFLDFSKIENYKNSNAISEVDWDERYVENSIFSRSANIKFVDNGISYVLNFNEDQTKALQNLEFDKVLSLIPNIFLDNFNFNIDKSFVVSGSGGDILYFVKNSSYSSFGGYKTGSLIASGYGVFGILFFPLSMLVLLLVFPIVDAYSSRTICNADLKEKILLSPAVVPLLSTWFFYLTSAATGAESLAGFLGFLIRGWWINLFLYVIFLRFARLFVKG